MLVQVHDPFLCRRVFDAQFDSCTVLKYGVHQSGAFYERQDIEHMVVSAAVKDSFPMKWLHVTLV